MAIEEAKPDEGRGNNVVQATFDGSTGMPAQFVASGLVAGNPAQTSVSGVVLDNSNMPIPGVTMHLLGLSQGTNGNVPIDVVPAVQTDSQGQFTLTQAPIGVFKLMADGTTAAVGTKKYPTLEFDVTTVAGRQHRRSGRRFICRISIRSTRSALPTPPAGRSGFRTRRAFR